MGVRIPLPLLRAFSSVEPERHSAKVEAGGSSPPTLTTTGFPGSSSGRTWAFEVQEQGSNPCPGASAGEAQVAVHLFRKEDVGGSTPSTGSTLSWCVRSGARTPDCQSGGDEFESRTHRPSGHSAAVSVLGLEPSGREFESLCPDQPRERSGRMRGPSRKRLGRFGVLEVRVLPLPPGARHGAPTDR